jgi:hypothetical protein
MFSISPDPGSGSFADRAAFGRPVRTTREAAARNLAAGLADRIERPVTGAT